MQTSTIKIRVLLFATLREAVGKNELELEVPPSSTPTEVWNHLVAASPALKDFDNTVMVAVNQEYVQPWVELKPGDEVAFIPPISGG
jgi:molybdopterin converting factor subunit 1